MLHYFKSLMSNETHDSAIIKTKTNGYFLFGKDV